MKISRARDTVLPSSSSSLDTFLITIRFQTPFDGFLCFKVYLTKRGRLFQPHLLTTFPIESFDVMQIKTDSILTYSRSEQLFVIHGYHLG